jgi:hypothetical protein
MIIKLPICIDEKIIFSNFIIKKNNDKYFINLFNRNYEEKIEKIKVPLCNNFQGISYLDIFFPLELTIINNKILFPYFMQKIYLSQNNLPIDFFFNIENQIKQLNISFIKKEELSKMELTIWKYCTSFNENINLENSLDTIKRLWEVAQINLNSSIYLLNLYPEFTNKSIRDYQKKHNISKKLISITNAMKTIKYSINSSNEYIFIEHFNKLNNNKVKSTELKIGYKYFVKLIDSNKFFQIEIDNIQNNVIHTLNNQAFIYSNYEWCFYIPNIPFDFDTILFNLFQKKECYNEIFEKTNLKIEAIHTQKLLEYYFDNKKCSLVFLRKFFENEFDDFNILENNNYSNVFFEYITKKYNDLESIIKVYKSLFKNYTYPLKQNKLDFTFDNILYFSFINLDKICKECNHDRIIIENGINDLIPYKLKTLFYNTIQLFYTIINKNNFQILYYNQKFFTDYLHRFILKNIIFDTKSNISNLFNSKLTDGQKDKINSILKNTLLCIDVANRLNWTNLPKKLSYLEIFYSNKDLVINIDKLNKNIFSDNYDLRLKKIIENPFEMFKFLKKEKDYIKWVNFLGPLTLELFVTPISLSGDDLKNLGKLIFILTSIEEQNIKNPTYIKFLNFCQKNSKLIMDNTRINLKIKDHFNFVKCQLNLGFLAKHLTFNKTEQFDLEDDKPDKNEYTIYLEDQNHKLKQKYFKYKTKYYQSKNPNMNELPFSQTSKRK